MNDLQSKSDEELNVMLAGIHFPQFPVFIAENGELRHHYDVGRSGPAFNYCADLNAVAKVEAGLTENQKGDFINALCTVVESDRSKPGTAMFKAFFATARQHTEALIQTLTP